MSYVFVKYIAAQMSSSVRPVDCVSQKVTSVMVTMTAEITRMKETVDTVNVACFDCDQFNFTAETADKVNSSFP